MSQLRIPSDALFSVQQALRELDERMDRIVGGGVAGLDEAIIRRIVQEEILASARTRRYPPIEDLMRATGPSHMHGLVPDPGPAVGTSSVSTSDQVLHEDGQWKWPLSGNLVDVSDPTDPIKRYNLHGALLVDGALSSSNAQVDDLIVAGNAYGVQGDLYQNNTAVSNSGSSETVALSFSIPGGVMKGKFWSIFLDARLATAANANVKTITVKFGATSYTAYSAAGSGLRIWLRLIIFQRAASDQVISSYTIASDGTVTLPAGVAATENTDNSILVQITLTGTASSDVQLQSAAFVSSFG